MNKTYKIFFTLSLAILGFFIYPNLPKAHAETLVSSHTDAPINCDTRNNTNLNSLSSCGAFRWSNVDNGTSDWDSSGNPEEGNPYWDSDRAQHFNMYRADIAQPNISYQTFLAGGRIEVIGCYSEIAASYNSEAVCRTLLDTTLPAAASGTVSVSQMVNLQSLAPGPLHRLFNVDIYAAGTQLSWTTSGTTYGRHVSIDSFSASTASAQTGVPFNVNWALDNSTGPTILHYYAMPGGSTINGTSVSGDGQINVSGNSATVVVNGSGNVTFELETWGYGLYQYDPAQGGYWCSNFSLPECRPPVMVTTRFPHPAEPSTPPNITVTVGGSGPSGGPGSFGIHHVDCYGWPTPTVSVVFQISAGATGYDTYRRVNGGAFSFYTNAYQSEGSSYYKIIDTNVTDGSTYEYRITATNSSGSTDSLNTDSILVNSTNCGGSSPPPPPPPPPPPSGTCSDNASTTTITGLPAGNLSPNTTYQFTIRVTDTGNTRWYNGGAYQFVQNTSQNLSPVVGWLPYAAYPGDTIDWTFSLTTPSSSGNYSVSLQMAHNAGWNYLNADGTSCSPPASTFVFGSVSTLNFTVASAPPASISYSINYTPSPLNTPSGVSFNNSTCGQVVVNWNFTSNGVEQYFTVWRSTSSNLSSFAQVSGNIAANLRTWTDTPPAQNQSYYYFVKAHTTLGGTRETQSAVAGPVLNQACSSNISLTNTLTQINGSAYSSTAVIKNGDVLTFQLVLSNSGTSSATINYFCSAPSVNLTNLANLTSTAGTVAGITTDAAACPGTGAKRLNVSGTKVVGNPNWVVTFTATFNSATPDGYEVCSNTASVHYSDPAASNQSVSSAYGPILCKTNKGKTPDVREVAP